MIPAAGPGSPDAARHPQRVGTGSHTARAPTPAPASALTQQAFFTHQANVSETSLSLEWLAPLFLNTAFRIPLKT